MDRPHANQSDRPQSRRGWNLRPVRRAAAVVAVALGLALALGGVALADQVCPKCKRDVPDAYRYCPFDGTRLPSPPCPHCHKAMQPDWRFCPFDGTSLTGSPFPATGAQGDAATTKDGSTTHADAEAATAKSGTGTPGAGTAVAGPAVAKELPPPTGDNPIETIDRLFRAIQGKNVATIRGLYRWDRFFGKSGADLEPRIRSYVSRLTEQVGPIAERTDRVPVRVNLAPRNATLGIALRDRHTHAVLQEYDFELTDEGDGWRIVKVRP